ncbi:MAG: PSD1 domain-containing protein [Planctomycetia bacterium]|nr:PSD1 domain-containing protein [Planctomycetia bacterium]
MNQQRTFALCLALVCCWPAAAGAQNAPPTTPDSTAAETAEFFERQVRPILAERCFSCHGAKKQESALRLDSRSALLKGGEIGPVIELEKPAASRLLKAIRYDDPELQMPPDGKKLPEREVAVIVRWVEQGVPWPHDTANAQVDPAEAGRTHWAFQPIRRQAVPEVKNAAGPQSPIDHFVWTKLQEQGMAPAEPADRATLVRRASFDLIGLPPEADEVAAFVNDPAPDAFVKVVDRLLGSPHYGERWGRYWLDVARYADTKGYVRLSEERRFHYAFTYRDYVIRAFNEDLPFDQFVVQQLAADQLDLGENRRPLAALGFLTLGRRFTGNKHDIIDDRIDVVARGLLGLTVTCARCHDHKYDPISTADYYSLYGVFASSEDPIVPPLVAAPASDAATQAYQREFESRQAALNDYEPKQYEALLDEFRSRSADYLLAALADRMPPQQPLPIAPGEIRQVVVERWIDFLEQTTEHDPLFGPWRAFAALNPAEFERGATEIIAGWKQPFDDERKIPVNALVQDQFVRQPPKSMADVASGYGKLLAQAQAHWQASLTVATAAASAAPEHLNDVAEEQLRQVLYAIDSPVAVSRQEAFAQYLYDAPINDEIVKRRNAINAWLANTAQTPPRAHTLLECPAPCDPRILLRGNPMRPGKRVPRQFLYVLSHGSPTPFALGSGRLELAQAIVSRDNPLTARVLVNRVWAHHFGAGLVRSPSNFGLRGQAPTHPELLDYLAARFMDEGWSIKKLHRAIMLSSVYQQASQDRADFRARDPENRLLWKMNRRRLDFEALRDSLLLAAGKLDLASGGPSVDLAASGANRRTVYGLIDRQGLSGMLPTFDFASPDTHSPERYTTVVPQQALFLLNSPWLIDLARALADRADVKSVDALADRVARMVRIALGRPPTPREAKMALEFIEQDQNNSVPGGALNAWESFAQALLLSNEFIYVD